MGLGKTISTLTSIDDLMFNRGEVDKVLVIAPKRVARDTWVNEAGKWEHIKHLRIARILGTEKQRKEAVASRADIYVINRENVVWLVTFLGGAWPFDMTVIDESSSFKNPKSQRFKALKRVRPLMDRVAILTGTPAPNGLEDLWAQMYLLDQGQRLGKTLTWYRDNYFTPGKRNGHIVYEYNLRKGDALRGADAYEKEIHARISDICISMKAEDWLDLPERIDLTNEVPLSTDVMAQYLKFEKDLVLSMPDDEEITAVNAAGLANKLLQFSSGFLYTDAKKCEYVEIHNEKIDALAEIVEAANGNPVLVFYTYQADLARIKKHLAEYSPRRLDTAQDMRDWSAGKIPLACAHPASAGHGLNLQDGGHISVWFNPTYNLEEYQQAVKRLDRQGQQHRVTNYHLIVPGTREPHAMAVLEDKGHTQDMLLEGTKALIKKYRG